jgi:hypothetical protein
MGSGIRNPRPGIRDPESEIRKKPILDPGSRGQKGTGSRIRIRNTVRYDQNFVRGSQRDAVYLGWPIVPSCMSPSAGGWWREVSANEHSCAHGAQINFGDQTPYLTCEPDQSFCSMCVQIRKVRYSPLVFNSLFSTF